tara:strand:- start:228 stop:1430 length:1203 start_codon:yes stop_codon:yes gene_type:complete
MKNIFYYISFILLFTSSLSYKAQLETAAVVSVYTQGAKISPEMAESILRIELTKTEKFNVFDKLDMMEILNNNEIDISNCYGQRCLLKVGKAAKVDKMITASFEQLAKKIVITVKVYNVLTEKYDKIAVEEFINLDDEIQVMVQITLNKALGIENDQNLMNNFVYYSQPPEAPVSYIKNNGPRMGLSFMGGNLGKIISAPETKGGYGFDIPLFTQIGYQFEQAYLSAGNFQALIEGMVFLTGIEKNMFSPSFAFINGFRSSRNGWEFGFGPTFRFSRVADGYYQDHDNNNEKIDYWKLSNEWNGDETNFPVDSIEITNWSQATGSVGTGEYNYVYGENPNPIISRIDSRGNLSFQAGWVWAIGKTFHSGYLNIPVNAFLSQSKDGYYIGLSMGFNIAKQD